MYQDSFYCGRMTIGVPGLGTDGQMDRQTGGLKIVIAGGERSVYRDSGWILSRLGLDFVTNNFNCGRMTIGVPGFGTDGQMDRQTEGQKIVIAGGERSVYRDSGWI